jgi:hypothetical protein
MVAKWIGRMDGEKCMVKSFLLVRLSVIVEAMTIVGWDQWKERNLHQGGGHRDIKNFPREFP